MSGLLVSERVYVCVEGLIWLKGMGRTRVALRWDEVREVFYQKEELYERYRIPPAQRVFLLSQAGQAIPLSFAGLKESIEENLAMTRKEEKVDGKCRKAK